MTLDLDAIKARDDAATPGPWQPYFSVHGDPYVGEAKRGFGMVVSVAPDDYGRADCEFIAGSNRVLGAEVRRLQGEAA